MLVPSPATCAGLKIMVLGNSVELVSALAAGKLFNWVNASTLALGCPGANSFMFNEPTIEVAAGTVIAVFAKV